MADYTDDELDAYIAAADGRRVVSRDLLRSMTRHWNRPAPESEDWAGAMPRARRRAQLAKDFPGQWLVIPNGRAPLRANDEFYPYRPGSDFTWLVGEVSPGAALVIDPDGVATLYLDQSPSLGHPLALLDSARGAVWTGEPDPVEVIGQRLGLPVRPVVELGEVLRLAEHARAVRGLDPQVDELTEPDGGELPKQLARLRLIKDDHEIALLRQAAKDTVTGFEAVAAALPRAIEYGESFVEGLFGQYARTLGHGHAYLPVVAAGAHATILHWERSDGPVGPEDLLLLDAGVETSERYAADVTRTIPVSGRYSAEQRAVYDIVRAAQEAALAVVRPGTVFATLQEVSQKVLREGLRDLGLLPNPALAGLGIEDEPGRWTLHRVGHMLGVDVHDCAPVADEYWTAPLEAGHVLTVEPGLYFSPHDELVPESLRGIGVRIEDDVLVTADGMEKLSGDLPTDSREVEDWVARCREATN
ncbi:aminopeptidase P N-terminal domain-containing protein [Amycolatopsis thailandensis]|uniref:aminopeptidase P N-terminal domain-containing protein n=1 Tax=Amycolatopsis thailandensis TaxID=589330 RepID=UPI0036429ADF